MSTHCGYVVKVSKIRNHSNADRLKVATFFENDVIVDLNVKEGDIGIYFPSDLQLGEEYATVNNLVRRKDENGNNVGGYLDPSKRNITAIKLRGEKSDGLFMPLESLEQFTDISKLNIGDIINVLNGKVICQKYIPRTNKRARIEHAKKGKKKIETEKFPLFAEHADTEQLAYNLDSFKEGDVCYITLKMHGTSQRTAYTLKEKRKVLPYWLYKIAEFFKIKPKRTWETVTGTRRCVCTGFTKDTGYYGDNTFRKQYHDYFKGKLHKGEEVFYEVLGYVNESTLIMGEVSNKKTNDKEFIKQYGETTKFTYGCKPNESIIRVYRMTMTNEDGYVVEYPTELVRRRCEEMGVEFVPVFEKFIFTTKEDLMERVEKYYDGPDPVGLTHIREGVVVRIDNSTKFKAYKHKNFNFKCIEGISKNDATAPDIEEAQEDLKTEE